MRPDSGVPTMRKLTSPGEVMPWAESSPAGTVSVAYRRIRDATTASSVVETGVPLMETSFQAKFKSRSDLFSR